MCVDKGRGGSKGKGNMYMHVVEYFRAGVDDRTRTELVSTEMLIEDFPLPLHKLYAPSTLDSDTDTDSGSHDSHDSQSRSSNLRADIQAQTFRGYRLESTKGGHGQGHGQTAMWRRTEFRSLCGVGHHCYIRSDSDSDVGIDVDPDLLVLVKVHPTTDTSTDKKGLSEPGWVLQLRPPLQEHSIDDAPMHSEWTHVTAMLTASGKVKVKVKDKVWLQKKKTPKSISISPITATGRKRKRKGEGEGEENKGNNKGKTQDTDTSGGDTSDIGGDISDISGGVEVELVPERSVGADVHDLMASESIKEGDLLWGFLENHSSRDTSDTDTDTADTSDSDTGGAIGNTHTNTNTIKKGEVVTVTSVLLKVLLVSEQVMAHTHDEHDKHGKHDKHDKQRHSHKIIKTFTVQVTSNERVDVMRGKELFDDTTSIATITVTVDMETGRHGRLMLQSPLSVALSPSPSPSLSPSNSSNQVSSSSLVGVEVIGSNVFSYLEAYANSPPLSLSLSLSLPPSSAPVSVTYKPVLDRCFFYHASSALPESLVYVNYVNT